MNAKQLALAIGKDKVSLEKLPNVPFDKIKNVITPLVKKSISEMDGSRRHKEKLTNSRSQKDGPLKYLIVATGNIYDDVAQAQAAAEEGADIIAVIRATAQSLLDYVPDGITTEGFGGTYATQANFRIMRKGLDEIGKKLKRYIRLTNYSSGLCMAEIAMIGAVEGLDYLLNDFILQSKNVIQISVISFSPNVALCDGID